MEAVDALPLGEVFDDDSAEVDPAQIARELSHDDAHSRVLGDALKSGTHVRAQTPMS